MTTRDLNRREREALRVLRAAFPSWLTAREVSQRMAVNGAPAAHPLGWARPALRDLRALGLSESHPKRGHRATEEAVA